VCLGHLPYCLIGGLLVCVFSEYSVTNYSVGTALLNGVRNLLLESLPVMFGTLDEIYYI